MRKNDLQVKQKFGTYGVRLYVQIRFEFLNIKHFKHQTIKFALTLSQNLKMTLIQTIPSTMHMTI